MSFEQFHYYFILANKIIILSTDYSFITSLSQLIKEHTSHSAQARPTMHCIRLVIIIEKKKNPAIYLLAVSSLVLKLGLHIVVGSSRLDNHSQ